MGTWEGWYVTLLSEDAAPLNGDALIIIWGYASLGRCCGSWERPYPYYLKETPGWTLDLVTSVEPLPGLTIWIVSDSVPGIAPISQPGSSASTTAGIDNWLAAEYRHTVKKHLEIIIGKRSGYSWVKSSIMYDWQLYDKDPLTMWMRHWLGLVGNVIKMNWYNYNTMGEV